MGRDVDIIKGHMTEVHAIPAQLVNDLVAMGVDRFGISEAQTAARFHDAYHSLGFGWAHSDPKHPRRCLQSAAPWQ